MERVLSIAHVTILESFRRKDPYIVLILGFVIVLGAALFNQFGIEGLEKFVKDVALTVTNILCIVICVVAAARQLPVEIANRTLYPLLAKPVSRTTVFLGKYLGVGLMSSAVVLLFWAELQALFLLFGISSGVIFYQALFLRILSMWLIAAVVITLSLFLTHGANVTVSLLLCLAMSTFANTILAVHSELEGAARRLAEVIYWVVPHLELFDLSRKVIHEWPSVPIAALAALTAYAVIYSAIFIALGCWRFRRVAL
ncbi:MAG TPA: ABC transporter permease [Candidatus Hydrogenedentes bacterium]|nr:ABC transporter permease [Candidatus Hydrogenedentota bacterium]